MLVGRFIALYVGVAYVRKLLIAPFFVNVAESSPSAGYVVGIFVVVGNGDSGFVVGAVVADKLPDLLAVVCPASISTPDNQVESLPENFNGTEKALIELLLKTPDKVDYWNMCCYKMKKKIKPYVFAADKEFEYDLEAIQKVADNLMNTLKNIDNEKEE